jgi:hypothetical protein
MATAPTLTLTQLKSLRPCAERLDVIAPLFKGRGMTARQAVKRGATLDDLVWVAAEVAQTDKDIERRLRMWMADCAAKVLHIYERDRTATPAPRSAIIAVRAFANGEIADAACDAACDAAWGTAWGAARAAASAAAWDAASAAAKAAEEEWQVQRLVAWLSAKEPFRFPLPQLPEHLKQAA